jgi:TRAP transporter 4TM/12TM fusion protein
VEYRTLLNKIIYTILFIATIYHLYIVVHPFTPWSGHHIELLNIIQLQRATHVFFLVLLGFLINFHNDPEPFKIGGLVFILLSAVLLYAFLDLDIDAEFKFFACIFWISAVAPVFFPKKLHLLNLVSAILIIFPFIYMAKNFNALIYRAVIPEPLDLVMAFGETFLVLGLTYRVIGPVLPILVLSFMIYNIYGNYIPGVFSGPGFGIDMLLGKLYCETEAGLFGMITGVSLKYLVYFTTLGAVISALGFGRIISNIALTLVGKSPASPGRTSSILAVFMGLFSGSGAADTQFVATITKDLYERAGYDRYVAAGIVATVGSIAYVTPPIMGSISFIMVELLSIPYTWIIVMAIGPMLLYLSGIWLYNEFYVRREKLEPVEVAAHVNKRYDLRFAYVFVPIVLIIILIYKGFAINVSVLAAILFFIVIAYIDPKIRPPIKKLGMGLAEGFRSLIPIGVAVVCANVVMTVMVTSGVAAKFSAFLTLLSHGNLFFALIFAAVFSLILGMGVPPVATYVLTAALTAPAIQQLAVAAGIPDKAALLSTHMFLFYYAVLAEVTPPVGLSIYAASSVFETNPIKTGIYSALVALPKYLIGLSFICSYYGTATLILPTLEYNTLLHGILIIASKFILTFSGIVFLNAGVIGYSTRTYSKWERVILIVGGVLLFYPSFYLDIAVVILPLIVFFRKRKLPWIRTTGILAG